MKCLNHTLPHNRVHHCQLLPRPRISSSPPSSPFPPTRSRARHEEAAADLDTGSGACQAKRVLFSGGSGWEVWKGAAGRRKGFWVGLGRPDFGIHEGIGVPRSVSYQEAARGGRRMDLTEVILERGGWLSLGWDVDGKDGTNAASRRVEADNGAVLSESARCDGDRDCMECVSDSSFELSRLSAEVDSSGIEGILSRLEKERNITFGVGLRINGSHGNVPYHGVYDLLSQDSVNLAVAGQERSPKSTSIYINGHSRDNMSQLMILSKMDVSKNPLQPGLSWRTWTSERLGSLNSEFEAAEIDFSVNHQQDHEMQKFRLETCEPSDRGEEAEISDGLITHNELKSRLRHLQLQLSSVLAWLRSKSEASEIEQETTNSSDRLQKHYDAWEFQENEIMAAKDMLRSIRAKLSVLEGKMALATSDAQKIVEERQKQIDAAHRALQHLRTTCVVWPNHANEVILAGSFNGWTSQRRMERSSAGIFSLYLKLYPGRYEIKFVVDGVWKIDPLRPIVDNNGHENNLLIIT